MARSWANGPAGGTPLSAQRLNDLEADVAAAKAGVTSDAKTAAQISAPGSATRAVIADAVIAAAVSLGYRDGMHTL